MPTEIEAKVAKQAEALEAADQALKAATEYVATTQPALDRFNVFKDNFLKRAHQVAGGLAQRGIIESHQIEGLVDKLAADPILALSLVEKVAAMVQPDSLGKAATDVSAQRPDMSKLDPFEKLALFGDSRIDERPVNTGLVE